MLKHSGTNPVRLPARSPNLNAFSERFVLSIKSECLNKIIPLGEKHLRLAIKEYMEHYHVERNHQGLVTESYLQTRAWVEATAISKQGVAWAASSITTTATRLDATPPYVTDG